MNLTDMIEQINNLGAVIVYLLNLSNLKNRNPALYHELKNHAVALMNSKDE